MAPQDELDPIQEHHPDLTPTERKVLARVAQGETDEEIAKHEEITSVAVKSCLRRFRARTGLAGRSPTAWAVKHVACCIAAVV